MLQCIGPNVGHFPIEFIKAYTIFFRRILKYITWMKDETSRLGEILENFRKSEFNERNWGSLFETLFTHSDEAEVKNQYQERFWNFCSKSLKLLLTHVFLINILTQFCYICYSSIYYVLQYFLYIFYFNYSLDICVILKYIIICNVSLGFLFTWDKNFSTE